MRVVIALGGNALLRRGEALAAETQRRNVAAAAAAVAAVAASHEVVVSHGNGPQVGLLALQAEAYRRSAAGQAAAPWPLDLLGAESEGMIGYLIEQELANRLPGREVATLLTRTVVDADDPAFARPSKPIGPLYGAPTAHRLAAEWGWSIAPDGSGWRRVVPSPEPRRIVELATIAILLRAGVTVICAGGGGIPVVETAGGLRGVEAVIDKDLAAALLACAIDADRLLLLTDVDAVYADWPVPAQRAIRRAGPEEMRRLAFAPGSMAPKVEAACRFAARGGIAAIGRLADAAAILNGKAGTAIARDAGPISFYVGGAG
jgi:carbamate kinase